MPPKQSSRGSKGSAGAGKGGSSGSRADRDPAARLAADLRRLLEDAVKENKGFGGGVLRIERLTAAAGAASSAAPPSGLLLFEAAAGEPRAGSGEAMAPCTPFEVASVTKAFTSAAILKLWERGAFPADASGAPLDVPLSAVLRDLPGKLCVVDGIDYTGAITVRQLLLHRSGLAEYWDDGDDPTAVNDWQKAFDADTQRLWTAREILAYVPGLKPAGVPDTVYEYSDTNYLLLGLIIEASTGKSFKDALRELVFDPCCMADTYANGGWLPQDSPVSRRYEKGDEISACPRQSADWAGGGCVSTAADLARFIRALATDSFFAKKETHHVMRVWRSTKGKSDQGMAYGMGLFQVNYQKAGAGCLWGHDGWAASWAFYWPQQQIIFTGCLNQLDAEWQDLVEACCVRLVAEEKARRQREALAW